MVNQAYTISLSPIQFARLADLVTEHADQLRGSDDIRRIFSRAFPVSVASLRGGMTAVSKVVGTYSDDLERYVSAGDNFHQDEYMALAERLRDVGRVLHILRDACDTARAAIDDIV